MSKNLEEVGKIVDISPFLAEGRSIWLLLAKDGMISQAAEVFACVLIGPGPAS